MRIPLVQGDLEPEGRPLAGRALDADPPSHEIDQALRNRQSQPPAAEPAPDGTVHLAEVLEQAALLVVRDADPGIGDREPETLPGAEQPHDSTVRVTRPAGVNLTALSTG